MKNFKGWLTDKVTKPTAKALIPVQARVSLRQSFYLLSDDWKLRTKLAEEEDAESILTIQRLCYNGETPWTRRAIMHEIRYNKNAFYIVVYDGQVPAAFLGAWFVNKEAHITNIATAPAYQNKGIASYLLTELTHMAYSEEIEKVTLEVRVSNLTAQSLYRTLGFLEGDIKKNYYANNQEDALEMKLALDLKEDGTC